MVWREPKDHSSECYFSLTNITSKSKHIVKYPDLPSAMRIVHTVKSCLHQSLQKILHLAITTLTLMKIKDSKKGTMLIAIQHLKQV